MSRDDRDQRGGHIPGGSTRKCPGCEYCRPGGGKDHRRTKRAEIGRETAELTAETGYRTDPLLTDHAYLGGRCIRCNLQELDEDEQYQQCPGDPIAYSSDDHFVIEGRCIRCALTTETIEWSNIECSMSPLTYTTESAHP